MTKLKSLMQFNREHVLRNTAPLLANRLFKDRTGEKIHYLNGKTATVTHFYGYYNGDTAWWCELDDKPGVFILRKSNAVRQNQREHTLGESPVKVPSPNLSSAVADEVKNIRIHGAVPVFEDGEIWIPLKIFNKVDHRMYCSLYAPLNKIREDERNNLCRFIVDKSKPAYLWNSSRNRALYASMTYIKERLSLLLCNGKYDQKAVEAKLGAAWARLKELHSGNSTVVSESVDVSPAPESSGDVELLPYVRGVVEEMVKERSALNTPEIIDKLSRNIANGVFNRRELKRKVLFNKQDVDSVLTPDFKLDAILNVLS